MKVYSVTSITMVWATVVELLSVLCCVMLYVGVPRHPVVVLCGVIKLQYRHAYAIIMQLLQCF